MEGEMSRKESRVSFFQMRSLVETLFAGWHSREVGSFHWHGPEVLQAATSAAWNLSMFLSVRNRPRALLISFFQESLATTPWQETADDDVLRPVIHGGLQIFIIEAAVGITAGRNGAFDRVEGILTFLRTRDG